MGRNGNAVPDMGGGHMSESLYDFCRKYDRQYLLEEWDSEKNTQDAQRGHQHAGLSFIDLHALHHVCQNRLEPVLTEAGRQI